MVKNSPAGISIQGSTLVAAVNQWHQLYQFQINGALPAGSTNIGYSAEPGDPGSGFHNFFGITDVELDAAGNIYILRNQRIEKRKASNGKITTIAGSTYGSPSGNPSWWDQSGDVLGVGTAARFGGPQKIELDNTEKYLYVADTYNNKIKIIDLSNNQVSELALTNPSELGQPSCLYFDSSNNLYYCDMNGGKIKKITF